MSDLPTLRIPGLNPSFQGKVRDVYDVDDGHLLLVASDRISAFDVVLPTAIPGKGRVLTQVSSFWFAQTSDVIANHLTSLPLGTVTNDEFALSELRERAVIVRKAEALKIEAIVRGYLAGSGWQEYRKTGGICGHCLPRGLLESQRLPEPIFTPSTKAPRGEHDENISFEQAAAIVGAELAEAVRDASLAIYRRAADIAEASGLIVADTKFEFGLCDGELILIDELLTPDSSRFWDMEAYEPGRSQPSFDKQFVRDYLMGLDWNRSAPGPELPAEIVEQTAARYEEAYRRIVNSGVEKQGRTP